MELIAATAAKRHRRPAGAKREGAVPAPQRRQGQEGDRQEGHGEEAQARFVNTQAREHTVELVGACGSFLS